MEILTPVLNGAFVLIMTLVITWYMRDRFTEVDRRFVEFRQYVDQRFAEQKQDTDRRFGEVRTEMLAIRAELVNIALAVGAQPRPDTA